VCRSKKEGTLSARVGLLAEETERSDRLVVAVVENKAGKLAVAKEKAED